jgi:hypothetical protein
MKRTPAVLVALLLGLTLVLAGCGSGDGNDPGVASASDPDKKDKKDSGNELSQEDYQEAALTFAKCMREHGVDMDDPKDGRIEIKSGPGQEETMNKAQEACQKYLPPVSAADRKKGDEEGLKMSQCMRKNGVEDFPDPKDGGIRINEDIAKDPDFKKAEEACRDIMGGPGGKVSKK